jgi:branched-chain amino acid transport system permease protein
MLTTVVTVVLQGLFLGVVYATVALGLSLTMGVMGVVNLSHSAFIMLGSFLALELLERFSVDPAIAFFIALPLFFVIGAVVYRLIVARIERAPQSQGLVALFGLMALIESVGTMIWTTNTRVITAPYSNTHAVIAGATLASVNLVAAGLALLMLAGFWAFLRYTLTGRAIRAMGQDRTAARALGMDVVKLSTLMFALGIASAGAAGVAIGMMFPFAPQTQIQWLAWAFLIVILGGMGKVENTLLAGLFVGLVQTLATSLLPFDYVYLLLYAGLAVVLVVRREGLVSASRRAM